MTELERFKRQTNLMKEAKRTAIYNMRVKGHSKDKAMKDAIEFLDQIKVKL